MTKTPKPKVENRLKDIESRWKSSPSGERFIVEEDEGSYTVWYYRDGDGEPLVWAWNIEEYSDAYNIAEAKGDIEWLVSELKRQRL